MNRLIILYVVIVAIAWLVVSVGERVYWHHYPTGNPPGSIICGDGSQPKDGVCHFK